MDLSGKSLTELHALRVQIDQHIKSFETRAIETAREQLLALAKGMNVSLEKLLEMTGLSANGEIQKRAKPKKPGSVAAQYVDPSDSTRRWTGRGRMPLWIKTAIDSGEKTLEDFKI